MDRVVLPDCCEDWILDYGHYYQPEQDFRCLECASSWLKLGPGRFRRESDSQVFVERVRSAEGQGFPFLVSESGANPLVERCCARIVLNRGAAMRVDGFVCPVCGTEWQKRTVVHGGVQVPVYVNLRLNQEFAVQKGVHRSFLVPVAAFTLPRD